MQGDYYYEPTIADNFNALCHDLSTRKRFHDQRSYAILVVDQLFNIQTANLCHLSWRSVDIVKFDSLIGVNSEVFKHICSDELLFQHLLYAFVNQCRRNRLPFNTFCDSIFFRYFSAVLSYLLPISDDELMKLKKFDWFCAVNKHYAAKSALRLLRPQVIAASYSPDLIAHTDGFHSLYPRVFEFVKYMFTNLSDRTALPYEGQVIALKKLTLHYVSFILIPTRDADFSAFKQQLKAFDFVVKNIKPFLVRWLQTLALDTMYEELIDMWLSLLVPSDDAITRDRSLYAEFFSSYSREFAVVFTIIVERSLIADLTLASHVKFLDFVVREVFAPEMLRMYQRLGIDSDVTLEELQTKVFTYHQALEAVVKEKQKIPEGFRFGKLFEIVQQVVKPPTAGNLKEIKALLHAITTKLGREPSLAAESADMNTSTISQNTSSIPSFHPLANSTPIRKTPDFRTDPKTKLYHLTPEGRKEVIQRRATFDFSPCTAAMARITPHAGAWENEVMVKLLCDLSKKYSDSAFTRYLRSNNGRTWTASLLSKIFLADPYANKYVPVYSRNVPAKLPQLNLRFMASYPFLIILTLILWFSISAIMGVLC